MSAADVQYVRARSTGHALELLARAPGHARLLAGGQSLLPLVRRGLLPPALLVDIDRLSELAYVRLDEDVLEIGALTRLHTVSRARTVSDATPLLARVSGGIADPQVRHRATVGGNLASGDPRYDLGPVLLAYGAELVLRSADAGERRVCATEFFVDRHVTALRPGELLTAVRVPVEGPGAASGHRALRRRRIDSAIVGVAVVVRVEQDVVTSVRVGLGNMAPVAMRAAAVEDALIGRPPADAALASAADLAAVGTAPQDDAAASADYRRDVLRTLVHAALVEATEQTRAGTARRES